MYVRATSTTSFTYLDPDLVQISDAYAVIQHTLTTANIMCVCQHQSSPLSIQVHYIHKSHPEFGVDEQLIETWCRRKLILVKCHRLTSTAFDKEILELTATIARRSDFNQNICLLDQGNTIYLYGLPDIVQRLQQAVQSIIMKYKNVDIARVMPKSEVIRCIESCCSIPLGFSRLSMHRSASKAIH